MAMWCIDFYITTDFQNKVLYVAVHFDGSAASYCMKMMMQSFKREVYRKKKTSDEIMQMDIGVEFSLKQITCKERSCDSLLMQR